MNRIIFLLLILSITSTNAQKRQKLMSYTGNNGYEYKVGETITLNNGSDTDGTFNYVKILDLSGNYKRVGSDMSNRKMKITQIKKINTNSRDEIEMTCKLGLSFANIDLISAIRNCEIGPCTKDGPKEKTDKYDQLAKIKKLYDDGVLNEKEYEVEKKKVLDQ